MNIQRMRINPTVPQELSVRLRPRATSSINQHTSPDSGFALGYDDAYDTKDDMEKDAGDVAVERGFAGAGSKGVDYY